MTQSASERTIVATWNVNSVRVRERRLRAFVERSGATVVCLQELKLAEEDFEAAAWRDAGWHCAVFGQRSYNGVAILSRSPIEDLRRGFDDGVDDGQARFVHARTAGLRVVSSYWPNGQALDSEKYPYKLDWIARLLRWLDRELTVDDSLVLGGDFNIALDDRDLAHPERWESGVLYNETLRGLLRDVFERGLFDLFRLVEKRDGRYSWWDYRNLAFPKDDGLRIDYLLGTRPVARRLLRAWIDRDERKESTCPESTNPSDHAPVLVELAAAS